MKRLALVLALLLAVEAHGATWSSDFEMEPFWQLDSDPYSCRHVGTLHTDEPDPYGTITVNGITAKFGVYFALSRTLAQAPNRLCGQTGWYDAPEDDGHAPGYFAAGHSGSQAVRMTIDCAWTPDNHDVARGIRFDPPIRYFSAWVSGVVRTNYWACSPYVLSCNGGVSFNTHVTCPEPYGTVPFTLQAKMGTTLRATTTAQAVDGWAGCGPEYPDNPPGAPLSAYNYSNTLTPFCEWQKIEVFSALPFDRVVFSVSLLAFQRQLYIDDITATDAMCPDPPCEFERAAPARGDEPALQAEKPAPTEPPALLMKNLLTGEVVGITRRATPATRSTWGRVKVIYR